MSLIFKAIKPAPLSASAFKSAFMDAAQEMASEVERDFQDLMDDAEFRHAVPFEELVNARGNIISIDVLTDDLGFKYYDQGNGGPNEIIYPRTARVLHWVDKSGEDVFRKSVHGYSGRFAVRKIEEMWKKKAPVLFQAAINDAVSRSGQAK